MKKKLVFYDTLGFVKHEDYFFAKYQIVPRINETITLPDGNQHKVINVMYDYRTNIIAITI